MNTVTTLARTPAITLERFVHVPGVVHRDPEGEIARSHAVSFVEEGSYRLRVGGAWSDVSPDRVFAATPGLEFACRHDEDHPRDRCLSVRYSEEAIESLRSAGAAPAPGCLLRLTNRRAYLKLQLREGPAEDAARTEALAGALYWSLASETAPRRAFRPRQLAWYAARVERAREMMRVHYAEPLSLSRLAAEANMSLYHFARVFGELQGETPHQHLLGVRVERAVERLRAGATVTETCYAVGFRSLSHFALTLRRRLGVPPSALRPRRDPRSIGK